jgi:hypothetical protein
MTFSSHAQKILKHFSGDNGLLSSEVYQVLQDHNGYIWITTDEGVSRYDGYDFKHYNSDNGLPESTVLELFEDYKNRLWFVMITNELAYLENDTLHIYPFNDLIRSKNLENYYPIKEGFYVDSADNVYIGIYHKGIFKVTANGKITMLNEQDGRINSVYRIENKTLATSLKSKDMTLSIRNPYFTDTVVHFPSPYFSCRASFEEAQDNYYYADYNNLFVFKKNGNTQLHSLDKDVLWISKDNQNNLWFALHRGGAVVYNDSNFVEKRYHLLPGHSVTSVFEDNEGSIWLSTLYDGVYMFSPLNFKHLGPEQGVRNLPINKIATHNGTVVFAGNGSDLYTFKNGVVDKQKMNLEKQPAMCKYLEAFGDSIIISHTRNGNHIIYNGIKAITDISNYATAVSVLDKGLVFFHTRELQTLTNGVIQKKLVSKLFSDVFGSININDTLVWFATNNGLMAYEKNIEYPYQVKISPLLQSRLTAIIKSKGGIVWVASKDKGLISIKDGKTKDFNPDILNHKTINSLYDIDSLLIAGTNDGVILFKKDGDSILSQGTVKINSSNGLQSNEIFDVEYFNGSVYAANPKGVSVFSIPFKNDVSPLYFTNFAINGKDTVLLETYDLKYNQNFIDIEFVALNFQSNHEVKYMYILEGVDRAWRYASERKAQYSALSPGEYQFKLKAINSLGLKDDTPKTISIRINEAFYNTLWFRIVIVLTFLFLVASIFLIVLRIKLRESRKRYLVEQELNKSRQQALSAQMNPHFIYNSLNSVQSYILKNEKVKASEYLSKLGRLMRNILNNSQNQTITLREEFDALEKYMEMEQLRFRNLFSYRFNVCSGINLDEIRVPPLIIQPFVENAIHHGIRLRKMDGELLVDACINNNTLQIIVQDNGVGIENARKLNSVTRKNHKSFGTEITHKRLQLLQEMNKEKVTLSVCEAYPENDEFPGTKIVIKISIS